MVRTRLVALVAAAVLVTALVGVTYAQFNVRVRDPGVRGGPAGAGGPLPGLTRAEMEMFDVGLADFSEEEDVGDGVGPRFNFVGCAGCHEQPAVGGTSPAVNPLFRVTGDLGFTGNVIPSFLTPDGPIREARFPYRPDGTRDGGVHALFVITGHPEAAGCNIRQEDFERQIRDRNIIFRIPSPTFGAGLIEQIPDSWAGMGDPATGRPAARTVGRNDRAGTCRVSGSRHGVEPPAASVRGGTPSERFCALPTGNLAEHSAALPMVRIERTEALPRPIPRGSPRWSGALIGSGAG